MIPTVPCDTCGGSGWRSNRLVPPAPHLVRSDRCPDCVAGRVPSDEAVEAAAKGLFAYEVRVALGHNWTPEGIDLIERNVARGALLAVMRLAREENQ